LHQTGRQEDDTTESPPNINHKHTKCSSQNSKVLQLLLLLYPFNGFFSRTTWVSRYHKGKTSLDSNEARDDGVLRCSGISLTIYKQSMPCSSQITTSTPHQSILQAGCSSVKVLMDNRSVLHNITHPHRKVLKSAISVVRRCRNFRHPKQKF